jgi:hypothetical protein
MTMTATQSNKQIVVDSTKAVDIRFDCDTPHVVVYRVWSKQADADAKWIRIVDDELEGDGEAKSHAVPSPAKNSQIAYWLGIGGNAGTTFRIKVAFLQAGIELGEFAEEGQINEHGEAFRKVTVLCA